MESRQQQRFRLLVGRKAGKRKLSMGDKVGTQGARYVVPARYQVYIRYVLTVLGDRIECFDIYYICIIYIYRISKYCCVELQPY